MCLGIPMQVQRVEGLYAMCSGPDGDTAIDLSLVGDVAPGSWLLTFLGAAREVIDAAQADTIRSALKALEAVMNGQTADIDAFFPDLANREPQLPDFLRPAAPDAP